MDVCIFCSSALLPGARRYKFLRGALLVDLGEGSCTFVGRARIGGAQPNSKMIEVFCGVLKSNLSGADGAWLDKVTPLGNLISVYLSHSSIFAR